MFSASTGEAETAGESGASSGAVGDACAGGLDILGHCYHQTTFEGILWPSFAAAGDFNGDGSQDVITTCVPSPGMPPRGICLLQLNGEVTILSLDWLGTGQAQVHAADFNEDGIPDILVSEFDHFAVFTVDDGEFVLHSEFIDYIVGDPADRFPFPAMPIDLDQDGVAEVVTGGHFFTGVRLWRLGPEGWAQAGERQPLAGCGDLQSGRVADLDGDGFPELVAIGSHNNCDEGPILPGSGWNQISILTGDKNGPGLVTRDTFAAELAGDRLDLGDFNNDGDVDIVVGARNGNMMVFENHGDGTFASVRPYIGFASSSASGPHAADFNADGFDDLMVRRADRAYRILVLSPDSLPTEIDVPESVSGVLLTRDLNGDGRADILSTVYMDHASRLVLTLSDP